MLSVPGNHDTWVHADPSAYTPDDQLQNGFFQFYGQDTLAASHSNYSTPFDFSVDPNKAGSNAYTLPPASNLFTYNKMGNVVFVGFSGAHDFAAQKVRGRLVGCFLGLWFYIFATPAHSHSHSQKKRITHAITHHPIPSPNPNPNLIPQPKPKPKPKLSTQPPHKYKPHPKHTQTQTHNKHTQIGIFPRSMHLCLLLPRTSSAVGGALERGRRRVC